MENIVLKDGRMEIIGKATHAIDIVREYCGDELGNYLSEVLSDHDTLCDNYDNMYERQVKADDALQDLILDMRFKLQKFEEFENADEFNAEQSKKMFQFMKNCLERVENIQEKIETFY